MKLKETLIFNLLVLSAVIYLCNLDSVSAQENSNSNKNYLQSTKPSKPANAVLAFPGADGFGKFASGGRGGTVLEVTNLNDDNQPGSFRWAVNQTGKRTIVFRTSGTIQLKSSLNITKGDLTIAGQTAPGDGICIAGYTLSVNAKNVIIRFIRSRLGDVNKYDNDAMNSNTGENVIIDHCSISWSVDEAASFYGLFNSTIQWCMISESLNYSLHVENGVLQEHGYGGIMGGTNLTIHHNLFAHHKSRMPRFSGGETPICNNTDFRNNVIYNWGDNNSYGGEKGKINVVNNYYKYGPATSTSKRFRIVEPYDTVARYYVNGNYVFGNQAYSNDNWSGGVQGNYAAYLNIVKPKVPFPFFIEKEETAQEAFDKVLQSVGASSPKRDLVDARIVDETKNGTAKFGTRYGGGGKGIIDSQNDVGGWPELKSLQALVDTDKDGLPDDWEKANGLNPNDKVDGNNLNADGYTMLEVYLNELVKKNPTNIERNNSLPTGFYLEQNYPNPFNPSTAISYKVYTPSYITLKVYDVLGSEVATLVDELKQPGSYNYQFSIVNSQLPSGIYFYRLIAGNFSSTKKMILLM